jgi:hypothetical protein
VIEQKDMVNSGVRGRKKMNLRTEVASTVEGGSVNRCFKTPVIIAYTGYRKGLSRKLGCGKIAALFLHTVFPRAVEIGRSLLPIFPHLAFRETFTAWKHLFTEPPSIVTIIITFHMQVPNTG